MKVNLNSMNIFYTRSGKAKLFLHIIMLHVYMAITSELEENETYNWPCLTQYYSLWVYTPTILCDTVYYIVFWAYDDFSNKQSQLHRIVLYPRTGRGDDKINYIKSSQQERDFKQLKVNINL